MLHVVVVLGADAPVSASRRYGFACLLQHALYPADNGVRREHESLFQRKPRRRRRLRPAQQQHRRVERRERLFGNSGGHLATHAAGAAGFVRYHDAPGLACRGNNRRIIERFGRTPIDHLDRDALPGQRAAGSANPGAATARAGGRQPLSRWCRTQPTRQPPSETPDSESA